VHTGLDRKHVPWPLHSPALVDADRPGHDRCRGAAVIDGEGDGVGDVLPDNGAPPGGDSEPPSPGVRLPLGLGLGVGDAGATASWSQCSPVNDEPLQSHTAPSPVTTHTPSPQSSDAQPVTCSTQSGGGRRRLSGHTGVVSNGEVWNSA